MKPEYEIIQKICEKMPAPDFPELPTLTGYGVLRLMNSLTVEFGKTVADTWFRGFLLDHATLKAVWGEDKINNGSDLQCACGEIIPHLNRIYSWQYHGHSLLDLPSVEGMLSYYQKYL